MEGVELTALDRSGAAGVSEADARIEAMTANAMKGDHDAAPVRGWPTASRSHGIATKCRPLCTDGTTPRREPNAPPEALTAPTHGVRGARQ